MPVTSLVSHTPIQVLVVDDEPSVLVYLKRYLSATEDIALVAEAYDGIKALEILQDTPVDVVLSDLHMPRMDGISLLKHINKNPFAPAFIAMTGVDTDSSMLQVLQQGAAGYIVKTAPPRSIVDAVRKAVSDQAALSQQCLARLVQHLPDDNRNHLNLTSHGFPLDLSHISDAEQQILSHLCDGLSNQEIAQKMHYSESTVKKRVSELIARFGATSRLSLVVSILKYQ